VDRYKVKPNGTARTVNIYHSELLISRHGVRSTTKLTTVESTVNIYHSELLISRHGVRSTTKLTTVESTDKYKEHARYGKTRGS